MIRMRALKSSTYGTRRLKAGDEFEATAPMAKVWEAMNWAERIDAPAQLPRRRGRPPKPRPEPDTPPEPFDPELERVRAMHEALVGPVDKRWSAATLQEHLAAAQAEAGTEDDDAVESPPGVTDGDN